jgi:hypothetical protein
LDYPFSKYILNFKGGEINVSKNQIKKNGSEKESFL